MREFGEIGASANPNVRIEIGDLTIQAVLDTGFVSHFQTSPEIHFHTYYELLISQEGELEILLQNCERIVLQENAVALIPPKLWHATTSSSAEFRKLAIRFSISQNAETDDRELVYRQVFSTLNGFDSIRAWRAEECREMLETVRQLCEEMKTVRWAGEAYKRALLSQFFVCFSRLLAGENCREELRTALQENENESRRLRIEEYFLQHYSEEITEEDLSRYMNLSKRQISRLLERFYASSFRQILIQMRLQRAAQLLAESEASIEEIAFSVGYTSLSGFYSAFAQKFEMTAGEYRKKLRSFS